MINFSCNGCGACCYGGISLTPEEYFFKHYDDFAVKLSLSAYDIRNLVSPEFPERSYKKQKKYLSDNFFVSIKTKSDRKVAVFLEFVSVNPAIVPCRNLNDFKQCSIYSRRPKVCSLYPYRIDTTPTELKHGLLMEKSRSIETTGEIKSCEGFVNTQEVIFTDKPTDPGIIPLLNERTMELRKYKSLMKQFIQYIMINENICEQIERNSAFNTPNGERIALSLVDLAKFYISRDGYLTYNMERLLIANSKMLKSEAVRINEIGDKRLSKYAESLMTDHVVHETLLELNNTAP
ncbi:flagellin N-methylase family protein [Vibrio parahaemolyticus VPCR-2010]|uniref:YkgJ family cysteine cluster protein n=1 Tax=Vibrio parahaemolyticus TaxID=670 RepID=UPI00038E4F39|nr:flagellin N-methylase family protein [Vibrio parahaemolyticus VPCR-2010]